MLCSGLEKVPISPWLVTLFASFGVIPTLQSPISRETPRQYRRKLRASADIDAQRADVAAVSADVFASSADPSGICLPRTELLQSPFRTQFSKGSRSRQYRRSLRRHRQFLRSYCWILRSYRRSLRRSAAASSPIVARLAKHNKTLLNIVKHHETHAKHCDTL